MEEEPEKTVEKLLAELAELHAARAADAVSQFGPDAQTGEQSPGLLMNALLLSPDAFLAFDLDGRVVTSNPRASGDLGYPPNELVGMHIAEISTRRAPEDWAKLVTILRENGPQTLFGHNRRKDGSVYPVEARLWISEGDDAENVFGFLRDASDMQELIEERDQLISLIESSTDIIAVASPDERYIYMNGAGLEMVGVDSIDELSRLTIPDLHPESEHRDLFERVLPQVRSGRWEGELYFQNLRTGGVTPCWLNSFAIRQSTTGDVIGIAVVAQDISTRKDVERRRERLLRLNEVSRNVATSLLENDDLNRAIAIILEGVGKILGVTRSHLCRYREDRRWLFRTHQWSEREGRCVRVERQPESSLPYTWATEILARGDVIRLDDVTSSKMVPSGGSPMFRHDTTAALIVPVIIHGRMESFFGFSDTRGPREWEDDELAIIQIIVDSFARAIERRIADRERSLIAKDLERSVAREKKANQYKSEFLANMSHELRTPMNAIVGYAELLSRPNVDSQKQTVWVKNIKRSTDYLLSLISDVLDLSKIEAGQMTTEKVHCDLTEAVSEVVSLLRMSAEEKLLELDVEFDGPIPEFIASDPVRLRQILVNLIGNAIKFTHQGSVSVRLRLEQGEHVDEQVLRISVVDTGIGMTRDALEELFLPFSQVHGRRDARFGGTGLGLVISRHLARRLGGDIEVESTIDVGSRFTLVLPLSSGETGSLIAKPEPRAGLASSAQAPPDLFAGCRVLVVDDSPENAEVIRFLLEESGSRTDWAENGALGVRAAIAARAAADPFDAILMDMNMPVMDGFEATAKLKEAGIDEPIIALTAFALSEDKKRTFEAGCADYVSKPIVPHVFFSTIARHVKSRTIVSEVKAKPTRAATFSLADNPRFGPLIERYVSSFEPLADRIRADYDGGDVEKVRTEVHRLRGTASNYGFPEISQRAGVVEDAIRGAEPPARVRHCLADLLALLERVARERRRAARDAEDGLD